MKEDELLEVLNHHSESLINLNKETTALNDRIDMICHIEAWILQAIRKSTIPKYILNEIEELKVQLSGAINYYNNQRFSKKESNIKKEYIYTNILLDSDGD